MTELEPMTETDAALDDIEDRSPPCFWCRGKFYAAQLSRPAGHAFSVCRRCSAKNYTREQVEQELEYRKSVRRLRQECMYGVQLAIDQKCGTKAELASARKLLARCLRRGDGLDD